MGVIELVFELLALNAKNKGGLDRLCCYGNFLSQKDGHNKFTSD